MSPQSSDEQILAEARTRARNDEDAREVSKKLPSGYAYDAFLGDFIKLAAGWYRDPQGNIRRGS